MRYCLGFAFDNNHAFQRVLLIKKTKPEWQCGKLNGIGGKIEPTDPTHKDAMVREFREETTIETTKKDWRLVGRISGHNTENCGKWVVAIYSAIIPFVSQLPAKDPTEEKLTHIRVDELSWNRDVIPNLQWLIPLCLDEQIGPFNIIYKTKE